MKIYINGDSFEIFEGAKVQDALNLFFNSLPDYDNIMISDITDSYGNLLMMDGTLLPGTEIFIDTKIS